MATVRHNVVAEDLDGMLGDQLVFKKDMAGRTIISYKPNFDENRTFSPAQQAQQEAFREAMALWQIGQGQFGLCGEGARHHEGR